MLTVAAGSAVVALAWLRIASDPEPAAPLPPADASVTEMADAYMSALASTDCATVTALSKPNTHTWCADAVLVSFQRTGQTSTLPGAPGDPEQTCVDYVITTNGSKDGSLNPGQMPWNLCFQPTEQGWRLSGQGHI